MGAARFGGRETQKKSKGSWRELRGTRNGKQATERGFGVELNRGKKRAADNKKKGKPVNLGDKTRETETMRLAAGEEIRAKEKQRARK